MLCLYTLLSYDSNSKKNSGIQMQLGYMDADVVVCK